MRNTGLGAQSDGEYSTPVAEKDCGFEYQFNAQETIGLPIKAFAELALLYRMPRFFAVADADADEDDEEIELLRVEVPEAADEAAATDGALDNADWPAECVTGVTEAAPEGDTDGFSDFAVDTSRFLANWV